MSSETLPSRNMRAHTRSIVQLGTQWLYSDANLRWVNRRRHLCRLGMRALNTSFTLVFFNQTQYVL